MQFFIECMGEDGRAECMFIPSHALARSDDLAHLLL